MALFKPESSANITPTSGGSILNTGFDIENVNSTSDLRTQLVEALNFDALQDYTEDDYFQLSEQAGYYRGLGQMAKRISKAKQTVAKEINNLTNTAYQHHTQAMKAVATHEKNTSKFLENASLAYLDIGGVRNDQAGFATTCGQAERYLNW